MEYTIEKDGDWTVISLDGAINFECTDTVKSIFEKVMLEATLFVRLNLENVPASNSSGIGIILMFTGYGMMGIPGQGQLFIYISLFIIALGTGFFKGNLAVILGNDGAGRNRDGVIAQPTLPQVRKWLCDRSDQTLECSFDPEIASKPAGG